MKQNRSSTLKINNPHVTEQFEKRFKKFRDQAGQVIENLRQVLEESTPKDWRFTESPSSRFFIVHEESGAKFFGMSYRCGEAGKALVEEIQKNASAPPSLFSSMERFVQMYIEEILRPDLPVHHEIRTVYGKKGGEIGEEKQLYEQTRRTLYHTLPLVGKKIAARPNAVLGADGYIWVRQYMNWVSMTPGSREYYLFHPLTQKGPDRNQSVIFSYTENGDIKRLPSQVRNPAEYIPGCASRTREEIFTQAEAEGMKTEKGLRTESYWRIPTLTDRRLIDLDFKDRYARGGKSGQLEDPMSAQEIVELYFLREIVEKAKAKLYK